MNSSSKRQATKSLFKSQIMQCTWLANLNETQLSRIYDATEVKYLEKGEYIIKKGGKTDGVFGIAQGKAKVSFLGQSGTHYTIHIFNQGAWFGEICLLYEWPRTHDVITFEPCYIIFIPREILMEVFEETPSSYKLLTKSISKTLIWMFQFVEAGIELPLPQRLAARIIDLLESHGISQSDGEQLELKISQQDLANLIYASRQKVNKELKAWQEKGIISYKDGQILILDREQLDQLSRL